jgi:adenylosuccinate lyase
VSEGLVVYPKVNERHVLQELPFIVTENIILAIVKMDGDRQVAHEKIRVWHSSLPVSNRLMTATGWRSINAFFRCYLVRLPTKSNNSVPRTTSSSAPRPIRTNFTPIEGDLYTFLDPKSFVGRTPGQVEEFTEEWVKPVLDNDESRSGIEGGVKVELSV